MPESALAPATAPACVACLIRRQQRWTISLRRQGAACQLDTGGAHATFGFVHSALPIPYRRPSAAQAVVVPGQLKYLLNIRCRTMITIRMGHRSPGSVMATRRFSLSLLLLLLLLQSVAAAVIVKTRKHPVGHVLDLPPLSDDHLKGFRFVGLIDPPRLRKRNRKGKVCAWMARGRRRIISGHA
eukprot:1314972-Pleurochrysis_carterae.AAC.5